MESEISNPISADPAAPLRPPDSSPMAVTKNSAALRRLMEEVRYDDVPDSLAAAGYNRAHNRHNRS
jgi:hypothetical protein